MAEDAFELPADMPGRFRVATKVDISTGACKFEALWSARWVTTHPQVKFRGLVASSTSELVKHTLGPQHHATEFAIL